VVASHDPDAPPATMGEIVRAVRTIGADRSVAACLEELVREQSHLAAVRNWNGTVVGRVTLEDLVALLLGPEPRA